VDSVDVDPRRIVVQLEAVRELPPHRSECRTHGIGLYSGSMNPFRRLLNVFWGKPGTPEEEAARAEAIKLKLEAKRDALTGHRRYEDRR
jgi:hypothetical protein